MDNGSCRARTSPGFNLPGAGFSVCGNGAPAGRLDARRPGCSPSRPCRGRCAMAMTAVLAAVIPTLSTPKRRRPAITPSGADKVQQPCCCAATWRLAPCALTSNSCDQLRHVQLRCTSQLAPAAHRFAHNYSRPTHAATHEPEWTTRGSRPARMDGTSPAIGDTRHPPRRGVTIRPKPCTWSRGDTAIGSNSA
jgi:hypothetical protein